MLKRKRSLIKSSITRIDGFVHLSESNTDISVNEFVIREETLCRLYKEFCSIQDEIELEDETQVEYRVSVENKYFTLHSKIKDIIDEKKKVTLETPLSRAPSTQHFDPIQVKLPTVSLPQFSGKPEEWRGFYDMFTALIEDNKQLSDVQKFYYLKNSLMHEPLGLIDCMPLTNENYHKALAILKDRYDNNLVIINSHIKAIMNLPSITKPNVNMLRNLITTIKLNISALEALQVPILHWDLLLIYILSRKLDFATQKSYELERNTTNLPTLSEFLDFLEKRCQAFETLLPNAVQRVPLDKPTSKGNVYPHKASLVASSVPKDFSTYKPKTSQKANSVCTYCKSTEHKIYKCPEFLLLSDVQRTTFARGKQLCLNCLGTRHSSQNCNSSILCRFCSARHHSLLHRQSSPHNAPKSHSNANPVNSGPSSNEYSPHNVTHTVVSDDCGLNSTPATNQGHHVLLATAKSLVKAPNGRSAVARCLLDSASQLSFISQSLVDQLDATTFPHVLNIDGVGKKLTRASKCTILRLTSLTEKFERDLNFVVLDEITCALPQTRIHERLLPIQDSLLLADDSFNVPGEVQILLGADIYYDLLKVGFIKLGYQLPTLQNTVLGWVIAGPTPLPSDYHCSSLVTLHASTLESLENLIPKFWELETLHAPKILKPEEVECEKLFSTTTEIIDNRYNVRLPFKSPDPASLLGNSYNRAIANLKSLEKRLSKDSDLRVQYNKFITEYIDLGHASLAPYSAERFTNEIDGYFLPQVLVSREDSPSTKLRVVFNASSPSSNKNSLNSILMTGPLVQKDLFDIVFMFRTFQFVLSCDIKMMFRQIRVTDSDKKFQRILWRPNENVGLQCLELETVTYGTNCAPFLSTRCLLDLAQKYAEAYPLASKAVINGCYMDDVLYGQDSHHDLLKLKSELIGLLSLGSFPLHKWRSNAPLDNDTAGDKESALHLLDDPQGKVLGLMWDSSSDTLLIRPLHISHQDPFTKRNVLSSICKLFDPMGYLNPIITKAKLFIQKLWTSKLNWDDPLSPELSQEWTTFRDVLTRLPIISLPRWINLGPDNRTVEIHGFADASTKAYGACAYVRILHQNGSVSVNLLCARSRVAPLKTISLPRLELCAALLLSQLVARIYKLLASLVSDVLLYSDSTITLSWIAAHPSRWTTFVANRVSEIQDLTSAFHWNYIPSEMNPADLCSRGAEPEKLLHNHMWWNGPHVLQDPAFDYKSLRAPTLEASLVLPEQRKVCLTMATRTRSLTFERFSKFSNVQRALAYSLRFLHNCKRSNPKINGPLTVDELRSSLRVIISNVQTEVFHKSLSELKDRKPVSDTSLKNLHPFLDQYGIMRVGGRLHNSPVSFDQKHPIILPNRHHITDLLIDQEHIKSLHGGPQLVLSNIRLRYWFSSGKSAVKKRLHQCVTCFRWRKNQSSQLMGSLPSERTTPCRPFENVGTDFAGPLSARYSRARKSATIKVYICLFICMVTKAVHIELVTGLSTEAFLLALKRFIARRSAPSLIFCDNGTNFLGAKNKLNEFSSLFRENSNLQMVQDYLSQKEIKFKFSPPHSPETGGLWESNIKSIKYHLKRSLDGSLLTFEELYTILTSIEAMLNSRPLCSMTSDPSDLNYLTPGHFLVGTSLSSYPEPDLTISQVSKTSLYNQLTQRCQSFWKYWSVQYLHQLQHRPKWRTEQPNLMEGTLVLIKEPSLPPLNWKVGRVVETCPGKDGAVRVVKIKTTSGILTRPVTKLSPLPIESSFAAAPSMFRPGCLKEGQQ